MRNLPPIPGYHLTRLISESSRTLVFRGVREIDQQPVVLKLLKQDPPTLSDRVRLRNHYTLTHTLNVPGVVRSLALEFHDQQMVLVMADEGCLSLKHYFQGRPLDLATFLPIAIQLTDILDNLHRHRIIHKDINPSNILIHPDTQQIWLTDFGLASQLLIETQELRSPGALEGTLAYLSPEQTGRMNRGVDYRSDLYSLGVTIL
jgi:serine/threonine protein kinase